MLRQTRQETYCALVEGYCPLQIIDDAVCNGGLNPMFPQFPGCPTYPFADSDPEGCGVEELGTNFYCPNSKPECPDSIRTFDCTDIEPCGPDHPSQLCHPDAYITPEWQA